MIFVIEICIIVKPKRGTLIIGWLKWSSENAEHKTAEKSKKHLLLYDRLNSLISNSKTEEEGQKK